MFEARSGKPFAVAAFFDELLLKSLDLLVEQIVGLVDQADQRIGAHVRVVAFKPGCIQRCALLIGRIRLIGLIFSRDGADGR